jgi:hypothetical protein
MAADNLHGLTPKQEAFACATARARGGGEVAMKLKVLPPNSPEAKRRDELLAIMRNETRPEEERDSATIAALSLCHEEVPPIVVYTNRTSIGGTKMKRRR